MFTLLHLTLLVLLKLHCECDNARYCVHSVLNGGDVFDVKYSHNVGVRCERLVALSSRFSQMITSWVIVILQ